MAHNDHVCVTYIGDQTHSRTSRKDGTHTTYRTVEDHEVGQRYAVHALGLYEGGLRVLTLSEEGLPSWDRVEAFESIAPGRVPPSWCLALRDGSDGWSLLIGFPELVLDPSFHARLIELDDDALRVFMTYAGV